MRCRSDVAVRPSAVGWPSGPMNEFSGAVDGDVLQHPVRAGYEPVEAELDGAPHDRPDPGAEQVEVAAELVDVPEVVGEPHAAHHPDGPARGSLTHPDRQAPSPHVRVVVRDPAACAVELARGVGAGARDVLDEGEERLDRVVHAEHRGRPVVHLGVDVDGVVRRPGRAQLVVPDALQVRRRAARPRAGREQVRAELGGHGRLELQIRSVSDVAVDVPRAFPSTADREPRPSDVPTVGDVLGEQCGRVAAHRGIRLLDGAVPDRLTRGGPPLRVFAGPPRRGARRCGEGDQQSPSPVDGGP